MQAPDAIQPPHRDALLIGVYHGCENADSAIAAALITPELAHELCQLRDKVRDTLAQAGIQDIITTHDAPTFLDPFSDDTFDDNADALCDGTYHEWLPELLTLTGEGPSPADIDHASIWINKAGIYARFLIPVGKHYPQSRRTRLLTGPLSKKSPPRPPPVERARPDHDTMPTYRIRETVTYTVQAPNPDTAKTRLANCLSGPDSPYVELESVNDRVIVRTTNTGRRNPPYLPRGH